MFNFILHIDLYIIRLTSSHVFIPMMCTKSFPKIREKN